MTQQFLSVIYMCTFSYIYSLAMCWMYECLQGTTVSINMVYVLRLGQMSFNYLFRSTLIDGG